MHACLHVFCNPMVSETELHIFVFLYTAAKRPVIFFRVTGIFKAGKLIEA